MTPDSDPERTETLDDTDEERVPDIPADAADEAERLTRLARAVERRDDEAVDENQRFSGDRKQPLSGHDRTPSASGNDQKSEISDNADEEASVYRERRDELVADHDYETRIREEDDTLVLYPEEWIEDGTVQFDRIEETDRAVEITLSGPGDPERWQETAEHNDELAAAVAEEHPDHAENARAFADFASNHYAKPAEKLTAGEVEEFLDDYYPRNAWVEETEASLIETSVRKMFVAADTEPPAPVSG